MITLQLGTQKIQWTDNEWQRFLGAVENRHYGQQTGTMGLTIFTDAEYIQENKWLTGNKPELQGQGALALVTRQEVLTLLRQEIQLCGSDPQYCPCNKIHCNDELEQAFKTVAEQLAPQETPTEIGTAKRGE